MANIYILCNKVINLHNIKNLFAMILYKSNKFCLLNPHSAERAGHRVKTSTGLHCMEIGLGGTVTVYTGAARKKKKGT